MDDRGIEVRFSTEQEVLFANRSSELLRFVNTYCFPTTFRDLYVLSKRREPNMCCDSVIAQKNKNIYTFQRDTQCSSTECLLMHRCQLYMFRTVTVHPQELLFRCCMCTSGTYQIVRFLRHTIICTYSI